MNHHPEFLDSWLKSPASPSEGCPPPEVFLEAVSCTLSVQQRARLADHVVRCPACAAEELLAQTFDAPAAQDVNEEDVDYIVSQLERHPRGAPGSREGHISRPTPEAPWPRRGRLSTWHVAAAALLVLGVGIAAQNLSLWAPPLPDIKPGGPMRGGTFEVLFPMGELEEMPTELRWSEREGATAFQVTVMTMDETVLWRGTSAAPPLELPQDLLATLDSAVVYFWRVEAVDGQGTVLASSNLVRFRVKPQESL